MRKKLPYDWEKMSTVIARMNDYIKGITDPVNNWAQLCKKLKISNTVGKKIFTELDLIKIKGKGLKDIRWRAGYPGQAEINAAIVLANRLAVAHRDKYHPEDKQKSRAQDKTESDDDRIVLKAKRPAKHIQNVLPLTDRRVLEKVLRAQGDDIGDILIKIDRIEYNLNELKKAVAILLGGRKSTASKA